MVRYPREGHGLREPQHVVDGINRCIDRYEKHFPASNRTECARLSVKVFASGITLHGVKETEGGAGMEPAGYLEEALKDFRRIKQQAERSFAQVSDAQFFAQLDEESNSIAIIVKHVGGGLRSRWTDFLTTDGEKPNRHRDTEFVIAKGNTRESLMARWEDGWRLLFASVGALRPEDLVRTITIRGEPHTVHQAINRQLIHHSGHAGQIVLLAKHFAGKNWQTLSVPRGKTEEFTARMREKFAAQGRK